MSPTKSGIGLVPRIEETLARRRASIAVSFDGREHTYAEIDRRSAAVATSLGRSGVGPGERVAVGLANSPELIVTVLGALRAGAAVVPLNPQASGDEVRYIVADAEARVAVVEDGQSRELRDACPPALQRITASLEEQGSPGDTAPARAWDAEAPALVVYTSGTTGAPKGVVLSQRALATNLATVAESWEWTERDRLLLTLPCFHMHGLGLGILASLLVGSTIVLRRRFDVATVLTDLIASQATMFFGVPTMYNRIVALPADRAAETALASMRLWVSGSAPLSAATFERFRARFGAEILERYGMTECCFVLSAPLHGQRRPGTVGFPLPGVDLRLVDPERADEGVSCDVPRDAQGEILIAGPSLFSGYWGRPEETRKAMLGSYLRSGDLAERDADGQFRIVGRMSVDIIKTRGFKVGAGEIEDCLQRHPAVAEVAVFGVPDADQGQRIIAAVTLRAGAVATADELRAHARAHLAPHKVPSRVEFLEEIPRTGPGKFKKAELVRRYSRKD